MDPNECLKKIREYVKRIQEETDIEKLADMGEVLAGYVDNLDQWILNGGFIPEDWDVKY